MPTRKTTERFIEESIKIHGNLYDYSGVEYINTHEHVKIICSCGFEFYQAPVHHLHGSGCPKCSGKMRKTTEEFIKQAIEKHGEKYDYSQTEYINAKTKVKIFCKTHNEFFYQHAGSHIQGNGKGCMKCAIENSKKTLEQFILDAKAVHGDKYDYSESVYLNSCENIIIICPEHGKFVMTPNSHVSQGSGCLRCYGKVRRTPEQYIEDAIRVHGDKYDYKETVFLNSSTKVKIFCNTHNEFFYQNPINHLCGYDCPKCANINRRHSTQQFIADSKEVHDDKYDYSEVDYILTTEKVIIKCKEHGNFLQTPSSHLTGAGCPSCKSSRGENKIKLILKKFGLSFDPQYSDPTCKYKNCLYFDFYVYDVVNWILEFQGEQHYKIAYFSSDYDTNVSNYEIIKIRDNIKRKWCFDNNIPLLEIHYKDKDIEKTIREFRDNIERMK